MLSICSRRLYYVCDKVIVRNLRRNLGPASNPGVQRRLDAFKEDGIKIQDDDAEEFVEQSESDFYKVGDVYNEHLNETLIGKHELRHHVIKEKYFKQNMPNLLTWSEKEQIRHLAATHPEEWTLERIAESFPVTVSVAKKLVKFAWKPASEQRIARHDASAMRNWRELKEGTLHIPEDLRTHFLKFSERTIPPLNKKSIKIDITQVKDLGEFEQIIRRCADRDEKSGQSLNKDCESTSEETSLTMQSHKETVIKKDSNRITLDELTSKIKKRLEKCGDVNASDKLMYNTISNTDSEQTIEHDRSTEQLRKEIELFNEDKKEKITEYKEKDENVLNVIDYPLRIRIPKKAYKKGATFKVNDCYYDHDGKFLYRVLGMSN